METATTQPAQNAAVTNQKEQRLIQIPDPVHGYIPVEARFLDIVDTPEFQRLRSIEQGSFRPGYPGARHDRFIHSLGTYHLATKFVEHFFKNLRNDVENIQLNGADEEKLKLTFRYAALLHDVGHAPFSHTTEGMFKEQTDSDGFPVIWNLLCREIENIADKDEYDRFRNSTDEAVGAPHEIMSALVLLRNHEKFMAGKRWKDDADKIDPELAARMIIGYRYTSKNLKTLADPARAQEYGIRNCLISMLNSKVMDVDRMDYLGRDTLMSGYVNAPVDLDTLARSVTAVPDDNHHLIPAFREDAIGVIDTMFNAKLSHDAWVLAQPAGVYDAALREHCIRSIDALTVDDDKGKYLQTVFTVDALSADGKKWDGKTYRLLCDADIISDMKARNCDPFNELLTRLPDQRRLPAWRTYFEFRYLFDDPASGMTADLVYNYFQGVLAFMEEEHLFEFNEETYQAIKDAVYVARAVHTDKQKKKEEQRKQDYEDMKPAAEFLKNYLEAIQNPSSWGAVLLKRTNNYTMTIDPASVCIRFTHSKLPRRSNGKNYATFGELRNLTDKDYRSNNYFYLYCRDGLKEEQLKKLREDLIPELDHYKDSHKT